MDHFKDYETLTFAREGRILTITLNLPDSLNAVNARLHTELSRVFTDANTDPESDVVVRDGREAGRSAPGASLDWMQEAIDEPAGFEITAAEAKRIIYSQLDLQKPLICRMNGHAIGLGASLALTSDIVIASDKALIGDPHVSVGLVAGDGGAILWPQMIGFMRAREYLFTGDAIPATEAARMGLISRSVPPEQLDEAVYTLARRIAGGATKAIRWTKITTNMALKSLIHAYMDTGVSYEILSNTTEDHQEAVNAFREKRKPVFTGR